MSVIYSFPPDASAEQKREVVLKLVNGFLKDSDWTQLPDALADAAAWSAYRKALRDLLELEIPDSVEFPDPPALEVTPELKVRLHRRDSSFADASLASQLKSLTPAQAIAYIETNVTNLQEAKVVLKVMVRMLIAMRNRLWPNMPEE